MIDIATLRAMAAAGASVDVILAAVEAELVAEGERVQARRAKDAERQRRKRGRHADSTESHPVTRSHADGGAAVTLLLSSSDSVSKQEESKKERKSPRARKSLLPDAWNPKPSHYDKGQQHHLAPHAVDQKAEDMRNWAKSKAIMRADWDATFHGFLRPKEGYTNGTGRKSLVDIGTELADEARELERKAGITRSSFDFRSD
jgi:hypothetical protein